MYLTNMFAGKRIYTFEVIASSKEGKHLVITEETESSLGEKVAVNLTVSDQYVPIFTEMVNAAARFMNDYQDNRPVSAKAPGNDAATNQKTYRVEEKRKEHAKAYAKWTTEEDSELKRLYAAGKSIKDVSEALDRNPGAIRSRLVKLGLAE